MKITSKGRQEIAEVPWGCWLWQMPDGSFVADDQQNFLRLFGMWNDESKKQLMRDFVRSEFGITEGRPYFMRGNRPVTDEEYEHQKQRMAWGLTPDPLDIAAVEEDRRNRGRS